MNTIDWLLENNEGFRKSIQKRLAEMLPGGRDCNVAFKPEFKEEEIKEEVLR